MHGGTLCVWVLDASYAPWLPAVGNILLLAPAHVEMLVSVLMSPASLSGSHLAFHLPFMSSSPSCICWLGTVDVYSLCGCIQPRHSYSSVPLHFLALGSAVSACSNHCSLFSALLMRQLQQ